MSAASWGEGQLASTHFSLFLLLPQHSPLHHLQVPLCNGLYLSNVSLSLCQYLTEGTLRTKASPKMRWGKDLQMWDMHIGTETLTANRTHPHSWERGGGGRLDADHQLCDKTGGLAAGGQGGGGAGEVGGRVFFEGERGGARRRVQGGGGSWGAGICGEGHMVPWSISGMPPCNSGMCLSQTSFIKEGPSQRKHGRAT